MEQNGTTRSPPSVKRAAISDQQRRRKLSLQRQAQHRRDAQHQARCLASFLNPHSDPDPEPEPETTSETEPEPSDSPKELDIRHASKLKGAEARKWFARQHPLVFMNLLYMKKKWLII